MCDSPLVPEQDSTRKEPATANYACAMRSNYFEVTDEDAYDRLFAKLDAAEDELSDFTIAIAGDDAVHYRNLSHSAEKLCKQMLGEEFLLDDTY